MQAGYFSKNKTFATSVFKKAPAADQHYNDTSQDQMYLSKYTPDSTPSKLSCRQQILQQEHLSESRIPKCFHQMSQARDEAESSQQPAFETLKKTWQ